MMGSFLPQATLTFEAIGTTWVIELQATPEHLTPPLQATILDDVLNIIDQYDRIFSRFRPDSIVTRLSKQPGQYPLPDYAIELFALYDELFHQTKGRMTPLVGQMLSQLGYDATYSFSASQVTSLPEWGTDAYMHDSSLTLTKPTLIDIGALGKGQLVDLVFKYLHQHQLQALCINAGGDIFYFHQQAQSLQIALEHPQQPSQAIGVANIANQAICGSSGNRRRWGSYHHIIDPATAQSTQHILATWVVAGTTMQADAVSTALFFIDPNQLALAFPFEYAIVYPDMSLITSPHFPARFFT